MKSLIEERSRGIEGRSGPEVSREAIPCRINSDFVVGIASLDASGPGFALLAMT